MALLWIALRRRSTGNTARDALLVYGFGFGLARELFMFTVKSLRIRGVVETATLELFFPPVEHLLLAVARIIIGAAFILFLLESRRLTRWYLTVGIATALLSYLLIAPFWWGEVIADPEIRFGKHWGDWVFHGHGLLASLIVIVLLYASRDKSRLIWVMPFFMFFLFDALMLYNLATGEVYKSIFGADQAQSAHLGYSTSRVHLPSRAAGRRRQVGSRALQFGALARCRSTCRWRCA